VTVVKKQCQSQRWYKHWQVDDVVVTDSNDEQAAISAASNSITQHVTVVGLPYINSDCYQVCLPHCLLLWNDTRTM